MTPSVPCCTCTYIYIKSKLGIGESMIGMHAYFSAMPLQVQSRLSGASVGNVGEGSDVKVAGEGEDRPRVTQQEYIQDCVLV